MPLVKGPFRALGTCIYCGTEKENLTSEHIIAFGLGGDLVLPKSSCRPCAKITGQIEQRVLRTMIGNFRVATNWPTRRKKERPSTLPWRYRDAGGRIQEVQVPSGDHPGTLRLVYFDEPRMLAGEPIKSLDFEMLRRFWLEDSEKAQALTEKFGPEVPLNKFFAPAFASMLAKMAYSYTCATIGFENIDPYVRGIILQPSPTFGHWVGGTDYSLMPLGQRIIR